MQLNCDLGEIEGEIEGTPGGQDSLSAEEQVMPHIHLANIACGFHAGSPVTMRRTLALASRHGVAVGAHPSYPDRENFGRTSVQRTRADIIDDIHEQVSLLETLAREHALALHHIKPHGALYNDMMAQPGVRLAVFEAVATYSTALPLVVQATPQHEQLQSEASTAGISLMFEAFADRRYTDQGLLQPRSEAGAVLNREQMLAQVELLWRESHVETAGGNALRLRVDTLCVHGDNAEGVAAIANIRRMIERN